MMLAISQATTLSTPFAEDVENYPAGGCTAMELWLTKLEKHLKEVSVDNTRKALADRGIQLVAASYQGGLLLSQGEQRQAHFDHFKRRLDLCQSFQIPILIVVADFASQPDATAVSRAVGSLAQAAQWAAAFGVKLALEFRGTDSFCSSLDTALNLIEQCREANVGICFDMFHFYKGPSKHEDLDRLTATNLFHVHVSDVAGVPRELMTDSDRVLPGDGDFHYRPLIRRLKDIDYRGAISLEVFNPVLWQMKPTQVIELGMAALQRLVH